MLVTMLSGFKASVQTELNAFFAHLANQADLTREASAQAFSKARKQFSHLAFARLNQQFITLVSKHLTTPRWNGLRVVAADASKMRMYLQDASHRLVREVSAFALYLPDLEMTLSSELYNASVGERQMLFEHLHKLSPNDLLVLDRGYPARWLIAHLTQRGIHFCMRVDQTGFVAVQDFIRSGAAEQIVTIRAPKTIDCIDYECRQIPSKVRLVKIITPNGRLYVVMTSLLDNRIYPACDFTALYHSRWRIEEAFKRLKHRLALEHTSGLSWLAAQQDFGAKMLADNLHALTVLEAENYEPIKEGYKINRTYTFSHLNRCLPRWLLVAMPTAEQFVSTLTELLKNLVASVPEISKPRPKHPKPHRKHAYKSTV
jgi:Transposase DDE domain